MGWGTQPLRIWQFELCYAEKKIATFVHADTNPRFDPDGCVRLLDDGGSGELASPREQGAVIDGTCHKPILQVDRSDTLLCVLQGGFGTRYEIF